MRRRAWTSLVTVYRDVGYAVAVEIGECHLRRLVGVSLD